jgi:hypothetical protein
MASKVWDVMNDLEMVTSKICSAREIIDSAIDRIQEHQYDKAEMMMSAAYEYLEYYLQEFDAKFKLAWQETVVKQKKEEDDAWDAVNKEKEYYEPSMPPWGHSDLEYLVQHKEPVTCDKDDPSPECKGAWNSFWEENYYPEEYKGSTVSSVQYTEEEINAMCDKAASDEEKEKCHEYNLREAEYYDKRVKNDAEHSEHYYDYTRNDPNRKNPFLTYDEAVAACWEMTGDGFWIPPQSKKTWVLPVEHFDEDYFVTFPTDLLDAANLKEGDQIYWHDNRDGSFTLIKAVDDTPKPLGMDEC